MFYSQYLDLCSKKGESPSKVALKNGISKTSVTRWKNGAVPNAEILQKLAQYFQVSTDYLLNDEEKEKKPTIPMDDELLTAFQQRPALQDLFKTLSNASDDDLDVIIKLAKKIDGNRR